MSNSYNTAVLADTPLGFWEGNHTGTSPIFLTDSSGNSNGLEIHGSATLSQPGGSSLLTSMTLASGQYAYYSPGSLLLGGDSGGTGLSVEFWINYATNHNYNAGVTQCSGSTPEPFDIYVNSSGTLYVIYSFAGGTVTINATLTPGIWQHIVSTWDSTEQKLHLFVNGQEATTALVATAPLVNSGGSFRIGTRADAGTQLIGSIGPVAVYAHQLSSARVLAHYLIGSKGQPKRGGGFAAWWAVGGDE